MADESTKKIKFIPMLSQIEVAASQLPDPKETEENTFSAKIVGTEREILFERIEVYRADKSKTHKWTYKGRLFIDSRFQNVKK